jgi:hypothetical protein
LELPTIAIAPAESPPLLEIKEMLEFDIEKLASS